MPGGNAVIHEVSHYSRFFRHYWKRIISQRSQIARYKFRKILFFYCVLKTIGDKTTNSTSSYSRNFVLSWLHNQLLGITQAMGSQIFQNFFFINLRNLGSRRSGKFLFEDPLLQGDVCISLSFGGSGLVRVNSYRLFVQGKNTVGIIRKMFGAAIKKLFRPNSQAPEIDASLA